MAKKTPLHIFKPGQHTAMSGHTLAFSEASLAASAAAYNPELHEAPLVVGHPKHDMPAYGWVKGLAFSDGSDGHDGELGAPGLYADPGQVNPDFADMLAAGAFKKISAAFYSPSAPGNPVPGVYYLRHVGFLGAQPPAIKGLKSPSLVNYADGEDGVVTFEFGETDSSAPAETAATNATNQTAPAPGAELASPPATPPSPQLPPLENLVTPEEKAALEAENAQLRAQLEGQRLATAHAANLAYCEDLVRQGRLLPAFADVAVATLDHFSTQPAVVEFGEGEARAPLADKLRAMLAAMPAAVNFGEQASRDRAGVDAAGAAGADEDDVQFGEKTELDPGRLAQHKAIKAHMSLHKVDYAAAARAVIR